MTEHVQHDTSMELLLSKMGKMKTNADFLAAMASGKSWERIERAHPMAGRMQRVFRLTSFEEEERTRPALRYWLSRPPEERLAALEFLRQQSRRISDQTSTSLSRRRLPMALSF